MDTFDWTIDNIISKKFMEKCEDCAHVSFATISDGKGTERNDCGVVKLEGDINSILMDDGYMDIYYDEKLDVTERKHICEFYQKS